MKSVEVEGKTVEEALNKALSELDANKDMVDIEILDHGSKGLFNVIGVNQQELEFLENIIILKKHETL